MDNLIGDFTITSGEDPAVFETTFPRAVNLEDGLEMGIKSMAFGPIKNLLYTSVKLYVNNNSVPWEIHLADRYYESQADILLEIHRQLTLWETSYGTTISKLSEQNNELTLLTFRGFYLVFREDFFLNRNFKFKGPSRKRKTREAVKYAIAPKRSLKEKTKKARTSIPSRVETLESNVQELLIKFDKFKEYIGQSRVPVLSSPSNEAWMKTDEAIRESLVDLLDEEFGHMNENIQGQNEKLERLTALLNEKETQLNNFIESLDILSGDDTQVLNVGEEVEKVTSDLEQLKEEIKGIQNQTIAIKELIERQKMEIDNEVSLLKRSAEDKHNELLDVLQNLSRKLGHDEEQIFATDTTNHSSLTKDILHVSSVTVSKEIIRSFHMGFLYGDNIEDSLINEKETRLLTTLPFDCHRGYGFYEFINPVYKSIRVLKFDKLYFYILDKSGEPMKFNLYGDGKSGKKQFPTILNLHIRRSIKGKTLES